jgi:hypothetical protein
MSITGFNDLIRRLRDCAAAHPDPRTGDNTRYSMADIALSAFSVFFTQCPSFLDSQRNMKCSRGSSNAQTLFQIEKIPTDNHIRKILDSVQPQHLFDMFDEVYRAYEQCGALEAMRRATLNNTQLIALDGTHYFSSQSDNIHCSNCSSQKHTNGETTHFHAAITPVVVSPDQPWVLALKPEFIVPQDGALKQDCEINAAKRWLQTHSAQYMSGNDTLLGDDIYSRQPFCRQAMLHGFHFIFTCKPQSHVHLTRWIGELEPGKDIHTLSVRLKNKNRFETHTYRWANGVPLAEGEGALQVNWCELVVTGKQAKVLYRNALVTDFKITEANVAALVASGRARWKIENENNNTLKTKGYHLEHNFGHGKKHLSSLLATMNILAFQMHGLLHFCDEGYRLIRMTLGARRTFFEHIRALSHYHCFQSWKALMDFMMRGLQIGHYEPEG